MSQVQNCFFDQGVSALILVEEEKFRLRPLTKINFADYYYALEGIAARAWKAASPPAARRGHKQSS
jgi:hypothetical protein